MQAALASLQRQVDKLSILLHCKAAHHIGVLQQADNVLKGALLR